MSMKKGVSRGIFSNEAGLGTGSIAHACADTKKPVKQGFFGIFEVFVDTIVICTLTALVILCSGVSVGYGEAAGAELTISGFTSTYGGWVSIFTAVAMCCFAFSTIIGWGLYGTRCIEFLLGTKANKPFMVVYSLVAIVGATMNLGLMWSIARDLQWPYGHTKPYRSIFAFGCSCKKLVKEYFSGEGAASTLKNSREEGKNIMTSLFLCATISSKHYISVNTTPQHIFIGAYHFEEGRPLRIFRQRHGNFQCFMLPVNSRKIEMSDVKTLREKRVVGILPAFI